MKLHIHQTHFTIADFSGVQHYIQNILENHQAGLHLFPELFLSGYPLQDICLHKQFIDGHHQLINQINQQLTKMPKNDKLMLLMGGLDYDLDQSGLPLKIKNVIYQAIPGFPLKAVYTKRLLPNYDIFDEAKYYTAGTQNCTLEFNGKKLGLMICEDMWPSSMHPIDPGLEMKKELEAQKSKLDLIINLSASPFNIGKDQKRLQRASELSKFLAAPFVYVNKVGGEDEILFDGASFIVAGNKVVAGMKKFTADVLEIDCPVNDLKNDQLIENYQVQNTWESLFSAELDFSKKLPTLKDWGDRECEEALCALRFGIQEYARKCGFKKFVIALSGGMDSALVLAITRLILQEGQSVEAIYMPGFFSATLSYDLSYELCQNLGIKLSSLPIKFFHSAIRNSFKENLKCTMEGLADENIQSRLRGSLLYAYSNLTDAMVLNTSNKSELAVGYSTLYGDSVGAISVLGDLYKTQVFTLARYINKKFGKIIPEQIITRPPSAELRENQEDAHSLPPYERLDAILEAILSYRLSEKDIIAKGFSAAEVEKSYRLYMRSEFKRVQFCPIIKLKAKSFGFGHRVPICKKLY